MSVENKIQEILTSGILESYVLGVATAEEEAQVLQWMGEYPEIKKAVQEIELGLEKSLVDAGEPVPNPIKDAIYKNTIGSPPILPEVEPHGPLKEGGKLLRMVYGLGIIVAVLLGLLMMQTREKRSILNEKDTLETELNALTDECDDISQGFTFLSDLNTQKITLESTGLTTAAEATVWYNLNSDLIIFSASGLPELTPEQSYQLWAIIDGVPTDLGVIEKDDSGTVISIQFTGVAQAFAITIEPAGGSEGPTLEQMIVVGSS